MYANAEETQQTSSGGDDTGLHAQTTRRRSCQTVTRSNIALNP